MAVIEKNILINNLRKRLSHRPALYQMLLDIVDSSFNRVDDTGGPGGATWDTLSGKPLSFPPSIHTHSEYAATDDLNNKVDKITGKGLSTEDYSPTEKTKLSGIAAGATVGADWNSNIANIPGTFPPATHNHDASYEGKNSNIQTHIASAHAPSDAQKNSDITQAEITAKLDDATHRTVTDTDKTAWNGKQPRGYLALANDTLALALATNLVVKLTVTAARTLTTTVPPAGTRCTVLILTSGASSFVVTFGSGFKPTGTLATGTTTGRVFIINFISDGTNLYEAGRTAAMVA